MKTWKLVSGIISCVLFIWVTFQSCAAGMVNTLNETGEVSGTAGIILAVLMLAGGIVSISVRNSTADGKNGGNIALIVLYGLAAFFGFTLAGTTFADLYIWSAWCAVNAGLALVNVFTNNAKNKKITDNTDNK